MRLQTVTAVASMNTKRYKKPMTHIKRIYEFANGENFTQKDAENTLMRFMKHFHMSNDYFLTEKIVSGAKLQEAGDKCYHFSTNWYEGATLELFVFNDEKIALGNIDEQFAVFKGNGGYAVWEDLNTWSILHFAIDIENWEEVEESKLYPLFDNE